MSDFILSHTDVFREAKHSTLKFSLKSENCMIETDMMGGREDYRCGESNADLYFGAIQNYGQNKGPGAMKSGWELCCGLSMTLQIKDIFCGQCS